MVATGMPDTKTTGLGAVGMACPPCEHSTTLPCAESGLASARLPPGERCYIFHRHAPTTVSAVSLMSTVGPISVIVAPCPLLM